MLRPLSPLVTTNVEMSPDVVSIRMSDPGSNATIRPLQSSHSQPSSAAFMLLFAVLSILSLCYSLLDR